MTFTLSPGSLAPGATIGILGGGQLGRMLALAAAGLGLRTHVFAPEADSPAFDVCAERTIAAYEEEEALAAFGASVDVVTYEFENVPARTAALLSDLVPRAAQPRGAGRLSGPPRRKRVSRRARHPRRRLYAGRRRRRDGPGRGAARAPLDPQDAAFRL